MNNLPTDTNADLSPSLPTQAANRNRLTIAHLLLWTTTTAVFMAIASPPQRLIAAREQESTFLRQTRVFQAATVAIAPLAGAGLAALALSA